MELQTKVLGNIQNSPKCSVAQEKNITNILPGKRREKPLQHTCPSKGPGMLLTEVTNLQSSGRVTVTGVEIENCARYSYITVETFSVTVFFYFLFL